MDVERLKKPISFCSGQRMCSKVQAWMYKGKGVAWCLSGERNCCKLSRFNWGGRNIIALGETVDLADKLNTQGKMSVDEQASSLVNNISFFGLSEIKNHSSTHKHVMWCNFLLLFIYYGVAKVIN